MKKETKRNILIAIAFVLAVIGTFCGIYLPDNDINNTIKDVQNIVEKELQEIDSNIVVEDITENIEDSSNKNTIDKVTLEDEIKLEEEQTEVESFELQGDIAYEGNGDRFGLTVSGSPQLTYISQVDVRWKDYPYTSTNNKSQTIGSSGCGVASATMIIDAIVGQVSITDVADTFVKCGYRSTNNGTYWSAYRAVADEFNIGYQETSDIQRALDLLKNNNYVICSVGNGLFTTGGHYIVLVGIEGNTLKIYDPYLYSGKFNTSTRRGKVQVSGNTIYCSIENFKNYANYKQFFCYQNDNLSKFSAGQRVLVDVPVGIAWIEGDYALVDDWTNQFWIHKSILTSDSRVYGLGTIAYAGGKNYIVQIFNEQFWCKESNMTLHIDNPIVQIQNTVGQNRKLKQSCVIYSNSNLSGSKFNYKANTTITILENVDSNVDKIRVNSTGRVAYIEKKYYK